MSRDDCSSGGPACKQRFKGIENFLRRVAFNLGNTPSQTEVKIISCIPIDVTDLQQKIIHLERQLDEIRCRGAQSPVKPPCMQKPGGRTPVNTALCESNYANPDSCVAAVSCKSLDCDRSTSPAYGHGKRKSNVSFTLHTDEGGSIDNSNTSNTEGKLTLECTEAAHCPNEPKVCDRRNTENRKKFFKKKKKLLKKKTRSPCVYYAQTNSMSPFKSDLTEELQNMDSDIMSRSYLNKMINKQYKPTMLGDKLSQISQFSSPICRDIQPAGNSIYRYESDVCSCCHGTFHNIDTHMNKLNNPQTYMVNEIKTGSAYYDTKHYDLVPVKEKSVKVKKDLDIPRKKEIKPHIDIRCWPENVRTKHRYQPVYLPPTQNYHKFVNQNDYIIQNGIDSYGRKVPIKINKIEPNVKKAVKQRREFFKLDRPVSVETSKSCSIDFGNIYPKKVYKKSKVPKVIQPLPVLRRNAECLTTVINNTECQTTTNENVEPNEAKTEATLNQIKSILQSVLAEVKVSSQTRSQVSEDKPKKDAVVQKGTSHSNMPTSSLMNSITYSPYTMHPSAIPNPYIASCSRHLNSNQLYFPTSPMKCFQNFPLFIQTPGRHMCANCFRHSSHLKTGYDKQATTIATNTDEFKDSSHSKETEKLIKEIYKSMALTMEVPNKDTSLSEYEEMIKPLRDDYKKSMGARTEPRKPPKKIRNVVQAVSELFMKKDIVDSSDTPNTTFELVEESKLPSKETSTRSHVTTTDTEALFRKERLAKYLRGGNTQSTITEPEKRTHRDTKTHNATTITESDTSISETESDSTLVVQKGAQEPKQKKEKKGLLSKMLKSVKLFKPKEKEKIKKKDDKSGTDGESSSDSDDYQTIYSQKIEKTLKNNRPHIPKRKTHSKISYKQTYQRDKSPEKRKPYMEQEYRRYWNERLMFHDNKPKHSSEQPYSADTTPKKPAYYRTYEARSAFVEPKKTYLPKTELRKFQLAREQDNSKAEPKLTSKGLAWLKKHKMGIHCGEQWKKLILEG